MVRLQPARAGLLAFLSAMVASGLALATIGLWAAPLAVSELIEPGLAFKRYLAEMPPIKRIVFERSHQGKYGPGFVLADGAIQPEGYFLRHLSNSPYTTNLFICGLSIEHEWSYMLERKDVVYAPRDLWTNRTSALQPGTFSDFHMAARLGLPPVIPGTFRWISPTGFAFSSLRFPEYREDCTGRITRWDEQHRPVEILYESTRRASPAWMRCRVHYEYASPEQGLPQVFIQDIELKGGRWSVTNRIHLLELGLDPNAAEGYRFTGLQPAGARIEHIGYLSNGVWYVVHPDGSMTRYRYATVPSELSSTGRRTSILLFGLGTLVVTAVFLVRRGRRGQQEAVPGTLPGDRD